MSSIPSLLLIDLAPALPAPSRAGRRLPVTTVLSSGSGADCLMGVAQPPTKAQTMVARSKLDCVIPGIPMRPRRGKEAILRESNSFDQPSRTHAYERRRLNRVARRASRDSKRSDQGLAAFCGLSAALM